jgi:iron complex outermembrane receptor protein
MVPSSYMKTLAFLECSKAPLCIAAPALAALCFVASFSASAQSEATLKEVVVTATRFAEPAASLPLGVSVVTFDVIAASGVNSVNEAVIKLLGVPGRLDTSGGTNYTIDLRGFGETANSNQVVIVDGLRLNEGDSTVAGLSQIPIESVERIEVLRGTGAVLYGEGATGGVIVVTTKAGAGVKRITSAQLYAATGSSGLQDVRANAVIAVGGFSLDVAAADNHSDGHRVNFASVAKDLAVTAQWSNDWLRAGARSGRNDSESGLPGSLSTSQYETDPRQSDPNRVTSKTDFGKVKKDNVGVFIEANVGNWQLVGDANQRTKKYISLQWGSLFGYDVEASNDSLRARHESVLTTGTNVFVIGQDRSDWTRKMNPSGTLASANAQAYFLKNDFTFGSTVTRISAGWRTETMKKQEGSSVTALNESQDAWELSLSQPLTKAVLLYGRVGSSFRLANVDEFSFTTPGVIIKPQTSRDLELGARWTLATGEVDVRWYRNNLDNEIGYDATATGPWGPGSGANINFDPTQRQGLELEAKQAINSAFDLRINAAWRQSTFTAGVYSGNNVPLAPSKTLALHANWRFAAGHSLDGGLNWVSSQQAGGDFLNKFSMPAYSTVDLRYAYQLRNAELALGVANLMGAKYYSQAYLNFAGTDVGIYPEAGRTLTASLRVKF